MTVEISSQLIEVYNRVSHSSEGSFSKRYHGNNNNFGADFDSIFPTPNYVQTIYKNALRCRSPDWASINVDISSKSDDTDRNEINTLLKPFILRPNRGQPLRFRKLTFQKRDGLMRVCHSDLVWTFQVGETWGNSNNNYHVVHFTKYWVSKH